MSGEAPEATGPLGASGLVSTTRQNYYDGLFSRLTERGMPPQAATVEVAEAYLDGRPANVGKRKTTRKDRDRLFWTSEAVSGCTPDAWKSEAMVLALTRFMSQDALAIDGLLSRAADAAPDTVVRAARYSGLVLRQHSPRKTDLRDTAVGRAALTELCAVLDVLDAAYRERHAMVEILKAALAGLTAIELLVYFSLYAFEHLVPRDFHGPSSPSADAERQTAWGAISDLLTWKLRSKAETDQASNDESIAISIVRHLRPILFEQHGTSRDQGLQTLVIVGRLIDAQMELNEFIERSADAFSYDDSVRFERQGNRLVIVEVDRTSLPSWDREGRKLLGLHGYWFYRAVDAFVASDVAQAPIGRPENQDANQLAWIRALQGRLRLHEVYGIADTVTAETGESAPLFQALLALNLMSQLFLRDFLGAFAERFRVDGDWLSALRLLALDGLGDGRQNRLPLTWSDREAKVSIITGWTVTPECPNGSARAAAAILDFWTYDMVAMAKRQGQSPGLEPHLFERPVLKFGSQLIQLPWVVGLQNNSAAAINNLRRLGARRGQAREETQRIESNLAALLRQRGFSVLLNWQPPWEHREAGEVDVIAARDRHLFVLEVKSTYLRRSQRDAWLHATTTLRKAGRQLHQKVDVVKRATAAVGSLSGSLGLDPAEELAGCHGWIVDTSIERDHHQFGGFLKISLEELLIALRDDAHLLGDPEGLLSGRIPNEQELGRAASGRYPTLYAEGFSAQRFIQVIETEAVWAAMG